ncbi:hypothetical protein PA598K_01790 [Paenibacillus sp. 598K]|uniref:hypothetical protein n=1 Tax=Paenibacillus sp. 598K TaxID=1117987 RepID=UPI000FF90576|nr:hypothetical protein [Paenibacillus sp. 598K]GBF73497.1 hypothetical protein PA598K_01790 [Paenibacillus sp. 598K]
MRNSIHWVIYVLCMAFILCGCSNSSEKGVQTDPTVIPAVAEGKPQTDQVQEQSGSEETAAVSAAVFYGRVISILGNEMELEIGMSTKQVENLGKPSTPAKKGANQIMVKEKENPEGFVDFIAPLPPEMAQHGDEDSIFGANGEVDLIYTGEIRNLIIPAGTDLRNITGGKEALDAIKKGTILMIKPLVIENTYAGIEKMTIID